MARQSVEEYKLRLSIPRAELNRGALGFRHTEYLVVIDDCGKTYDRRRRFTNFVWLHSELRRRELACALPELPPKKVVGKFDQVFVERRRAMLEDYLQALLKLPAVVLDDTLWAFLDADLATALVPRFLNRPSSHTATAKHLQQLLVVVATEGNNFRLCDPLVLAEFVALAQNEAAEAAVRAPPNLQQALQARLGNRVRLCDIVNYLVAHERVRKGLVDAGMFGALLALLCRVTEDVREFNATEEQAGTELSSSASSTLETHKSTSFAVTECLQRMLEATRGEALLQFCQQDDGLSALRRLVAAEATSLHSVAASLLWRGLQHAGVVAALAGPSARGLPLLGKLLTSTELRARVLAALGICTVVRTEGALDPEAKAFCLEALERLPRDLDEAESRAQVRAAEASLGGPIALGSEEHAGRGGRQQGVEAASTEALSRGNVAAHRDPALVALLRDLCSPKELPRLRSLLEQPDAGPADAVVITVVAVLDHFVRQSAEEPTRLRDLNPLGVPLQEIVEVPHSDGDTGIDVFATATGEVRVRAARVLIRLDWPNYSEVVGQEPPPLAAFYKRSKMLEVLSRSSRVNQAAAASRVKEVSDHAEQQSELARAGGLTKAPCIDQARLDEFARHVQELTERRGALGREVQSSLQAVETIRMNLDHRGVKHGVLCAEVDELSRAIVGNEAQEQRQTEAQQRVNQCEQRHREALAQVEARLSASRESQVASEAAASRAKEAASRAAALSAKEAELAETCHNAPAQLERLQARLAEVGRRRAGLAVRTQQLQAEAERCDRRTASLKDADREAEAALASLADVNTRLKELQNTLHSELVLTDEEVDQLKRLEVQLQPARPSRLRRMSDPGSTDGLVAAEDANVPSWDDLSAEQEFKSSLHFRAFVRLRDERGRLWAEERRWLQAAAGRAEATATAVGQQRREQEQCERAAVEEEEQLSREIAIVDDPEGHAARLSEARGAFAAAHTAALQAAEEAAEAAGAQQLAEARLEQAQVEAGEASAELAAAQAVLRQEAEGSQRVRADLEAKCLDLESRVRSCLQEWRVVELEERRLTLLQARVAARLEEEKDGRAFLRQEALRLAEELQNLDKQLSIQPTVSPPTIVPPPDSSQWIREAPRNR